MSTILCLHTDYLQIYKLLQHSLASEAVAGLVDLLEFDDKRFVFTFCKFNLFLVDALPIELHAILFNLC